ncbi:MAG: toprim domain-containing protein [Thiothrix sp.]|nr:toprim domain-containing protein [Thiothrix sp.]HPQ95462.1 toprim domain-containing protein [Thiolinea sp.]
MLAHIGAAIPDPIINGHWHSGRGKLDKISYVGHYLPKGILVRYRDHRVPDVFHVYKEWEGSSEYLPSDEYRQRKAQADTRAKAAAEDAALAAAATLDKLEGIWASSPKADLEHPYTDSKCIIPIGAKQAAELHEIQPGQYIWQGDLLVPVYGHTGALQGIQQITAQGRKFARGSFKNGLLWIGGDLTTGEVAGRLYITEGWATGIAVHMRTRNPVVVAFSTGNLLATGQWARGRHPSAMLIFAADNDLGSFITVQGQQVENPGRYYAEQAALAVDAAVVTPPLGKKGDWCDWHMAQIRPPPEIDPTLTWKSPNRNAPGRAESVLFDSPKQESL